jgi:hypothetical protein
VSAFPFGGHPTFSAYLTWAVQTAKCKVHTGYTKNSKLSRTRIVAPSGKHVIVVGVKQSERLAPTFVAYLDRRLGLKCPWPYP